MNWSCCRTVPYEHQKALLDSIHQSMQRHVEQMQREMIEHALTCDDPVGCELRAWQKLFDTERK